jgi:hypothetical protein
VQWVLNIRVKKFIKKIKETDLRLQGEKEVSLQEK